MRELSLFTGAGGGVLGTKLLGWTTIGYVENDKYCQKIIKQRIADGILDASPIFGDIRKFISEGYAKAYQGMVDVVTAGFPCQPFSVAGKGKGENDIRNMWPSTLEAIRIVRPKYCFLENVPGLLSRKHRYFEKILKDLAKSGYDVKWKIISAAEMGAPHKRDRLWILVYTKLYSDSREFKEKREESQILEVNRKARQCGMFSGTSGKSEVLANSVRSTSRRRTAIGSIGNKRRKITKTRGESLQSQDRETCSNNIESGSKDMVNSNGKRERSWWFNDPAEGSIEPRLGRVANGVANRMDRIKAIGNGQVPEVVRTAWEWMMENMNDKR